MDGVILGRAGRATDRELLEMTQKGYTVEEIQKFFGYNCRTSVQKRLNQLGIYQDKYRQKKEMREDCLTHVKEQLESKGHIVLTEGLEDQNLLIDGKVRVDVLTSGYVTDDRYMFTLTGRGTVTNQTTERTRILPNGKSRKRYEKYCDYLFFVGESFGGYHTWLIPVNSIGTTLQTVSLNPNTGNGKYVQYYEKWEVISK